MPRLRKSGKIAMRFETYMLSNADCEYMRERINYRQEGDCFFIGIVRDENNKDILYNSAEFPRNIEI